MASIKGRQAWERIYTSIHSRYSATPPKASDFKIWAESQNGWQQQQTPNGRLKYVDKNGFTRLTLKHGSVRTPGSNKPHVELRNPKNKRINLQGKPVFRKSVENHTPIQWDI